MDTAALKKVAKTEPDYKLIAMRSVRGMWEPLQSMANEEVNITTFSDWAADRRTG